MFIKKILVTLSVISFATSCAPINQNSDVLNKNSLIKTNAVDSNNSSDVMKKLNDILNKSGKISDEDINISVYSSVANTVVGINSTIVEKGFFRQNLVKGSGSGVVGK